MRFPLLPRGPRCADCGASVDDVDLQYDGEAQRWYCADDPAGCSARTLTRALERIQARHGFPPLRDPTDGGTAPENDELDVRPVCERCHERKAVAEMDWLSADGVDQFVCASCRDAYERRERRVTR